MVPPSQAERQNTCTTDCDIGLLIGYDCVEALRPLEVISGKKQQPYAVNTNIGWYIVGATHSEANQEQDTSVACNVQQKLEQRNIKSAHHILETSCAEIPQIPEPSLGHRRECHEVKSHNDDTHDTRSEQQNRRSADERSRKWKMKVFHMRQNQSKCRKSKTKLIVGDPVIRDDDNNLPPNCKKLSRVKTTVYTELDGHPSRLKLNIDVSNLCHDGGRCKELVTLERPAYNLTMK